MFPNYGSKNHFYLVFLLLLSTENRGEFLEKLQRARAAVRTTNNSIPILSKSGPTRLVVGNWSLTSRKEAEIHIHNSDGQQQTTILREDLPGFIFESNRGTKHSFIAETSLGKDMFVLEISFKCSMVQVCKLPLHAKK